MRYMVCRKLESGSRFLGISKSNSRTFADSISSCSKCSDLLCLADIPMYYLGSRLGASVSNWQQPHRVATSSGKTQIPSPGRQFRSNPIFAARVLETSRVPHDGAIQVKLLNLAHWHLHVQQTCTGMQDSLKKRDIQRNRCHKQQFKKGEIWPKSAIILRPCTFRVQVPSSEER